MKKASSFFYFFWLKQLEEEQYFLDKQWNFREKYFLGLWCVFGQSALNFSLTLNFLHQMFVFCFLKCDFENIFEFESIFDKCVKLTMGPYFALEEVTKINFYVILS